MGALIKWLTSVKISFSFEVGSIDDEPHPEGNNFSTIERGDYTPVGFHAD